LRQGSDRAESQEAATLASALAKISERV